MCSRIRRDDLRHVVKGLLLTPVEYDCKCLRKAMRGIGSSDDDVLIEILCARPNGYIEQIKEKYTEMYDKGKSTFFHFRNGAFILFEIVVNSLGRSRPKLRCFSKHSIS